jgi:hypothetical protein
MKQIKAIEELRVHRILVSTNCRKCKINVVPGKGAIILIYNTELLIISVLTIELSERLKILPQINGGSI